MFKKAGVHAKGTVALSEIIDDVKQNKNSRRIGALALFIGVVRGEDKPGETVSKLELEAYEKRADKILERICTDLREEEGIVDVQIHHLLGEFTPGEELVYVVVGGAHRDNVYPVLTQAVARYKAEAPIFKKQVIEDAAGNLRSSWINENKRAAEQS